MLCHLVSATFTPAETTDRALISPLLPPPKTAILTYNVRGVGCSQGSQPWLGIGSDPADLSKVETVVSDLLGNLKQVMRFVSYPFTLALCLKVGPNLLIIHGKGIFLGVTACRTGQSSSASSSHTHHLTSLQNLRRHYFLFQQILPHGFE